MWRPRAAPLWRAAYRRRVRAAFATVPLYRERWALSGRTDPVLVPGRTGTNGGAIDVDEAIGKIVDLVPLAGGEPAVDPLRGLGRVLASCVPMPRGTLVAVLDGSARQLPDDLPPGVRGCLVDPADPAPAAHTEIVNFARRGELVIAVGDDKELDQLATALPEDVVPLLRRMPRRELDHLDGGPFGLIHDPVLGYLGALHECGRWHLDQQEVYARGTEAGLALTLLRQDSPCLVDILVGGGPRVRLGRCPRHGVPVVRG